MSNVVGAGNVEAEQRLVSSFKEMVVKCKEGRQLSHSCQYHNNSATVVQW